MQEGIVEGQQNDDLSVEDVKNAWASDGQTFESEQLSSSSENSQDEQESESVSESEEGYEQSDPETESEEQSNHQDLGPVIALRKQKQTYAKRVRELESQLIDMQSRVAGVNTGQTPTPLAVDPSTGKPFDENSVEGKVLKALNGIAYQQRQKEEYRRLQEKELERQEQYEELNNKLDEASEKYTDFDDVVRGKNVPFTNEMRDACLLIPNPSDVLYRLGKDRNELDRIRKLSPNKQVQEMVKISGQLLSKPKQASKAPPPLRQLRSNPGVRKPSNAITDNSSVSDIREMLKKNGWR